MKKLLTFSIDRETFSIHYSQVEDVVRIYKEGFNGGECRPMGGDKWRRFDSGCHVGVLIVQIAEFRGVPTLQVQRERTEALFVMDLAPAK